MHTTTGSVRTGSEKSSETQQIIKINKPRRKFVDLEQHGISYDGVSFKSGSREAGDRGLLIREGTFDQLIEITKLVSLKTAFLLLIFKKLIRGHQPRIYCTFNKLADELGTDSCVLRRYAKSLKTQGLLHFDKLKSSEMKEADEYVFTMGSKFERWLWKSKLFEKTKTDYMRQKGGDNSHTDVDKSEHEKTQTDHHGLSENAKQTITDCLDFETVHGGLPLDVQPSEIVRNLLNKMPLSSVPLSSVNNMSSASKPREISISTREAMKNWGTTPDQLLWMEETNSNIDFQEWKAMRVINV